MPWAVAGAAVSAGAGLLGGAMQSGAAKAGQKQAQEQFLMQRNDLGPYREGGLGALQAQQNLLGLNGQEAADASLANYQQSPGYTWQLEQGLRGVDASAAARGMLRSGATLKGEMAYAEGLANQDFGQYYQRLAGLSTLGESAAAGAPVGQAAQAALNGANAQSSIYGNTSSALGGTLNTMFNNKDFQGWLGGSGSPVNSTDVSNNALYQQGAFAAAGPGAWGPYK